MSNSYNLKSRKYGDVCPLLDVEDMVRMKKPDWKCVFTYVQSFYRRFRMGREKPSPTKTLFLERPKQRDSEEGAKPVRDENFEQKGKEVAGSMTNTTKNSSVVLKGTNGGDVVMERTGSRPAGDRYEVTEAGIGLRRPPAVEFVLSDKSVVEPFQKFKNFSIPPLPKTRFPNVNSGGGSNRRNPMQKQYSLDPAIFTRPSFPPPFAGAEPIRLLTMTPPPPTAPVTVRSPNPSQIASPQNPPPHPHPAIARRASFQYPQPNSPSSPPTSPTQTATIPKPKSPTSPPSTPPIWALQRSMDSPFQRRPDVVTIPKPSSAQFEVSGPAEKPVGQKSPLNSGPSSPLAAPESAPVGTSPPTSPLPAAPFLTPPTSPKLPPGAARQQGLVRQASLPPDVQVPTPASHSSHLT